MTGPDASSVFRRLDRELWLVTAAANGRAGGLIATSVSPASIVPQAPRVTVGIARQNHTWGLIEASDTFAMHLLGEEHLEWVWRFALSSGRDRDKLDGLETLLGGSGAPILDQARGWLDCRVEARLDTGDRTVYLAEVTAMQPPDDRPLLTLHRAMALAPTELRHELQRQMNEASGIEAAAILDWRRARSAGHER